MSHDSTNPHSSEMKDTLINIHDRFTGPPSTSAFVKLFMNPLNIHFKILNVCVWSEQVHSYSYMKWIIDSCFIFILVALIALFKPQTCFNICRCVFMIHISWIFRHYLTWTLVYINEWYRREKLKCFVFWMSLKYLRCFWTRGSLLCLFWIVCRFSLFSWLK